MMGQTVMQRSGDQSDQYVILVGNIPWKCKWQDLKDLVRNYSKAVERAEVYLNPDGRSRGFGFVRVRGREEALKVIRNLDGRVWGGRSLLVKLGNEHDVCPTASGTASDEDQERGKTPPTLSPALSSRRTSCSQYSSQAPYSPPTPQAPQYSPPVEYAQWPAFLEPLHGASQMLPYLNDGSFVGGGFMPPMHHQVPVSNCFSPLFYGSTPMPGYRYDYAPMGIPVPPDSFHVVIDHSKPWVPPTPHTVTPITGGLPVNLSNGAIVTEPRGIHVRNLPYDITWKELRDHLQEAGTIVRCEVPKGSNGKGKGYGTVLFKTQQEADLCLDLFNKSTLKGREIYLRRDKFATRKQNEDQGLWHL